jgi:type IV pilus assembly protein PilN
MWSNKQVNPWREGLVEKKNRAYFLALLIVIFSTVILLILAHGVISYDLDQQKALNQSLEQESHQWDASMNEIQAYDKEKKTLQQASTIIQALQIHRSDLVILMDGLARMMPEGIYLTHVTRQEDKIHLEGKAASQADIARFLADIESTQLLHSPQLSLVKADPETEDDLTTFHVHGKMNEPTVDSLQNTLNERRSEHNK